MPDTRREDVLIIVQPSDARFTYWVDRSGLEPRLADRVTVTDSITFQQDHVRIFEDEVTVVDDLSFIQTHELVLADDVTMVEVFDPETTFNIAFDDSVTINDIGVISPGGDLAVGDLVTVSDEISFEIGKAVADSVTMSDVYEHGQGFALDLADSVTMTDALANAPAPVFADSVTMSDSALVERAATTTFNPYDKHSTVSLSNGNLTYTRGATTSAVGYTNDPRVTGKLYFEMTFVGTAGANQIGLADAVHDGAITTPPASPGNAAHSVAHQSNTDRLHGIAGGDISGSTSYASGETLGFAVDLPNQKLWQRKVPSGIWNASALSDPATDAFWYDIGRGLLQYPYYILGYTAAASGAGSLTFNGGHAAFVGAIPTGFVAWSSEARGNDYLDSAAAHVEASIHPAGRSVDKTAAASSSWSTVGFGPAKTTGKLYFEVMFGGGAAPNQNQGVVGMFRDGSFNLADFIGNSANSTGLRGNGTGNYDASTWVTTAADLAYPDGVWIGCAIDVAAAASWFKKHGGTNWNNSGSANPATGVGGATLSGSGAIRAGVSLGAAGRHAYVNFGQAPFSMPIPSGFTAWDSALGPPAGLTVVGTSVASVSAGSAVVTWPTGTAAGDFAFITTTQDGSGTSAAPAGWDTYQRPTTGGTIKTAIFKKLLVASDISSPPTITGVADATTCFREIVILRGPTRAVRKKGSSGSSSSSTGLSAGIGDGGIVEPTSLGHIAFPQAQYSTLPAFIAPPGWAALFPSHGHAGAITTVFARADLRRSGWDGEAFQYWTGIEDTMAWTNTVYEFFSEPAAGQAVMRTYALTTGNIGDVTFTVPSDAQVGDLALAFVPRGAQGISMWAAGGAGGSAADDAGWTAHPILSNSQMVPLLAKYLEAADIGAAFTVKRSGTIPAHVVCVVYSGPNISILPQSQNASDIAPTTTSTLVIPGITKDARSARLLSLVHDMETAAATIFAPAGWMQFDRTSLGAYGPSRLAERASSEYVNSTDITWSGFNTTAPQVGVLAEILGNTTANTPATYVGTRSFLTASTSFTVIWPTGTAAGDYAVLQVPVASASLSTSPTTPAGLAGWQVLGHQRTTSSGLSNQGYAIVGKVLTAADISSPPTVTSLGQSGNEARATVWRGPKTAMTLKPIVRAGSETASTLAIGGFRTLASMGVVILVSDPDVGTTSAAADNGFTYRGGGDSAATSWSAHVFDELSGSYVNGTVNLSGLKATKQHMATMLQLEG